MKIDIKLDNVNIGDVFPNERALARQLGYPDTKDSKTRKRQYEDMRRYVEYQPTKKLYRGKPTKEIVLTEIKEIPDEAIDRRKDNGGQGDYINLLKPVLFAKGSFCTTYNGLMREILDIALPNLESRAINDPELYRYIRLLKENFKNKVDTALASLAKEYIDFHYSTRNYIILDNFLKYSEDDVLYDTFFPLILNRRKYDNKDQKIEVPVWRKATPHEQFILNQLQEDIYFEQLQKYNNERKQAADKLPLFNWKYAREYYSACKSKACEILDIDAYAKCITCENPFPQYNANYDLSKKQLHELFGKYMLNCLEGRKEKVDGESVPMFMMSYAVMDFHNSLFPNFPWKSSVAEGRRQREQQKIAKEKAAKEKATKEVHN